MSSDASGWTWKNSPYKGERLLVHLAIADVVNDAHGNEFWMTTAALATKAKCSRSTTTTTLADLLKRELLEIVERGTGRGNSTIYRFLMPPQSGREAGTSNPPTRPRKPRAAARKSARPTKKSARQTDSSPISQQKELKEPNLELALDGNGAAPKKPIERLIAERVFEKKNPKPAGKHAFVTTMTVARALLDAGWKGQEVEDAMVAARTISIGAVEIELNKKRPAPASRTVDTDRESPSGRINL